MCLTFWCYLLRAARPRVCGFEGALHRHISCPQNSNDQLIATVHPVSQILNCERAPSFHLFSALVPIFRDDSGHEAGGADERTVGLAGGDPRGCGCGSGVRVRAACILRGGTV